MKYVKMYFLIARESKSVTELMVSHQKKNNPVWRYNIYQSCQMSLTHLW